MAGLGNFEAATAAKLRPRPLSEEEEEQQQQQQEKRIIITRR